jgi:hypothetical protein
VAIAIDVRCADWHPLRARMNRAGSSRRQESHAVEEPNRESSVVGVIPKQIGAPIRVELLECDWHPPGTRRSDAVVGLLQHARAVDQPGHDVTAEAVVPEEVASSVSAHVLSTNGRPARERRNSCSIGGRLERPTAVHQPGTQFPRKQIADEHVGAPIAVEVHFGCRGKRRECHKQADSERQNRFRVLMDFHVMTSQAASRQCPRSCGRAVPALDHLPYTSSTSALQCVCVCRVKN